MWLLGVVIYIKNEILFTTKCNLWKVSLKKMWWMNFEYYQAIILCLKLQHPLKYFPFIHFLLFWSCYFYNFNVFSSNMNYQRPHNHIMYVCLKRLLTFTFTTFHFFMFRLLWWQFRLKICTEKQNICLVTTVTCFCQPLIWWHKPVLFYYYMLSNKVIHLNT